MSRRDFPHWSDDCRIGLKAVDTEHQFLLSMLEHLNNVFRQGNKKNREEIATSLEQFIDYTRMHFRSEEDIMRLCHYDGYERHCQEHEVFISLAEGLLGEVQHSEIIQELEIINFLKNWLVTHFLQEDAKLNQLIL